MFLSAVCHAVQRLVSLYSSLCLFRISTLPIQLQRGLQAAYNKTRSNHHKYLKHRNSYNDRTIYSKLTTRNTEGKKYPPKILKVPGRITVFFTNIQTFQLNESDAPPLQECFSERCCLTEKVHLPADANLASVAEGI